MTKEKIEQVFEDFKKLKVLVIGDIMIDAYLIGKVDRISPEAPVPIINVSEKDNRLGGAANVGLNLVELGVQTSLIGLVGDDGNGLTFKNLLEKRGIDGSGIVIDSDRPTTIKTRIISNKQQMMRVDQESTKAISADVQKQILASVQSKIDEGLDAIILEDYNKGMLQAELIENIIQLAQKNHVITCVDPKKDNFMAYKGVTLFKPNLKELREGLNTNVNPSDINSLSIASKQLAAKLNHKITFITLSEHGVYLNDNCSHVHVPAHFRNISDVSGAGDTVISVATVCLASSLDNSMIAQISNLAGGLVCEKSGVVPIDKTLLLQETLKHCCQ